MGMRVLEVNGVECVLCNTRCVDPETRAVVIPETWELWTAKRWNSGRIVGNGDWIKTWDSPPDMRQMEQAVVNHKGA